MSSTPDDFSDVPFMFRGEPDPRGAWAKWKSETRGANEVLTSFAAKAGRARAAEQIGEAFDVVEAFGVQLPAAGKKAIGTILFFLPTLELVIPNDPKSEVDDAARYALDKIEEAADLLGRMFDIKGR